MVIITNMQRTDLTVDGFHDEEIDSQILKLTLLKTTQLEKTTPKLRGSRSGTRRFYRPNRR